MDKTKTLLHLLTDLCMAIFILKQHVRFGIDYMGHVERHNSQDPALAHLKFRYPEGDDPAKNI